MAVVYKAWEPIKDLPDNWKEWCDPNLQALAQSWSERYEDIKETQKLKLFNERLSRQWAIETGIIERVYTLDRGITNLLIEQGIDASLIPHGSVDKPASLVISIIKDQKEVIDGLFDFVAKRMKLSTSYIKQMHQVFTRSQPSTDAVDQFGRYIQVDLLRGDYKKWPNNPQRPDGTIHPYCPPEQVAPEMERLIELHGIHDEAEIPPTIEAAWLHHRFTQIHPFQDGNGRIARALATLIFLREGLFPLVVTNEIREDYISALERADEGDLGPLVSFFSKRQVLAFRQALSISEEVSLSQNSIDLIIRQGVERLRKKVPSRVFDISKQIEEITRERLSEVANDFGSALQKIDRKYWAGISSSEPDENDFWFKAEIIKTAKELGYYANTRSYRAWVELRIKEERLTNLIFSFHALGYEFSGIMAVSSFLVFLSETERNESMAEGPYTVCRDIFQYSYRDIDHEIIKRYKEWLEETILIAVEQWRKQL